MLMEASFQCNDWMVAVCTLELLHVYLISQRWEWDDWLAAMGNGGKFDTLVKDDKNDLHTGSGLVSFHYSSNIITTSTILSVFSY